MPKEEFDESLYKRPGRDAGENRDEPSPGAPAPENREGAADSGKPKKRKSAWDDGDSPAAREKGGWRKTPGT